MTARFWNPLNLSPSEVRAVSGSDLSTIYSIAGTYTGVLIYGISIGLVGDIDLDGVQDFATLDKNFTNNARRVVVRAGATGMPIYTVQLAISASELFIEPLGDRNQDDVSEFAMSPALGGVVIIDGATGVVRQTLTNPSQWYGFDGLRAMGDLNGDGVSEVAFTLAQVPLENTTLTQRVVVHSGLDGQPLMQATLDPVMGYWSPNGFPHASGFGTGVFNGDGLADLVVPEPLGNAGVGYARVYVSPNVFYPTAAWGNVMDAGGARVDVLKVGAVGGGGITAGGATRAVAFPTGTDIAVHMAGPYGTPPNLSQFALFGKTLPGGSQSTFLLPFGLGPMCFPPEIFDPYGSAPLFTLLSTFGGWPAMLPGAPLLFPAQSLQVANTGLLLVPVSFWLQGFLTDLSKPWPHLSVTNAIRVIIR